MTRRRVLLPAWSGLGDVVAAVTGVLGIRLESGCTRCAHRQKLLNKMFPFPRWWRRRACR